MSFVEFKLLKLEMSTKLDFQRPPSLSLGHFLSRAGLLGIGMLGVVPSNQVSHCHGPRWHQAGRGRRALVA
jgi:hypothetical protein